jgi:methane monooxygenase component A beta chain/propane monooxygenase small subunit
MTRAGERLPEELTGKADFEYITPKGRRLTEYEAVTCYTQPQTHGGGLQVMGDFKLRPDGRPLFDPDSTGLNCADWFAFRDPNQMWQKPYYALQARAELAIDRTTDVVVTTGASRSMDLGWIEHGLAGAYLPFAHFEYGLFRALNVAARESLSDTVNSILVFNAADKLRHAQAISLLGLDLETGLPGFDGTAGRGHWLGHPAWQPVRRLIEEAMAIRDWGEIAVASNLVIEPLIGEPLRRLVFSLAAAHGGDVLVPVIAATASADWHRNARATRELTVFLRECPGGEGNDVVLSEWVRTWTERTTPVAAGLFDALEAVLPAPGLAQQAQSVGREETGRVGADLLDAVPVTA